MRRIGVVLTLPATLAGCANFMAAPSNQPATFARPDVVRFGATAAETARSLTARCATLELRQIDPPFLSNVLHRQMQIDCEGFVFHGRSRHVEFVFRDDALVMAWIMVAPTESQTMIAAMIGAYGEPTSSNAGYIAFENDRAAWRFEPAEILFYAPELDADMAPDFD